MAKISGFIEAIYQDGVLKPLEKLDLPENEKVKIFIAREPKWFESLPLPSETPKSLEEINTMLSSIKTSLARTIIEEREERL